MSVRLVEAVDTGCGERLGVGRVITSIRAEGNGAERNAHTTPPERQSNPSTDAPEIKLHKGSMP